jgi:hypothetical protein
VTARSPYLSSPLLAGAIGLVAWGALAFSFGACGKDPPPDPSGSQSGTAGGGGGCPVGPQPMFTIAIAAQDGYLPNDTSLLVTWSAGSEPLFELDNPATWGTPEQGGNVVCDLDAAADPPDDLAELRCHLWTSGPTEIEIRAVGYDTHKETLVPMQSEQCEGPVPTEAEIKLVREMDAGTDP